MNFFGQGEPDASSIEPDPSRRAPANPAPLADRMRPRTLEEWVGQDEVIGAGSLIGGILKGSAPPPSLIFWGPPGSGKTTLAGLLARRSGLSVSALSAVTSGLKEARAVIETARRRLKAEQRRTILFIDEIHRFNKAQQDAFLPHVENGTIILFGATTENPSFSLIGPLLSRCRVVTLRRLTGEEILVILRGAAADAERGLGTLGLEFEAGTLEAMARLADGDARRALNVLEQAAAAAHRSQAGLRIGRADLSRTLERTHLLYDRAGEEHFNLISALHKSVRSSDPQGALYWLARMLVAGEDPLYVARRLVRMAAEDIGLADPAALPQALAAVEMYRMLGSPEGELGLVQATLYLATAPKSNSADAAWQRVRQEIEATGAPPTPMHLRNAPTALMRALGYGEGYQYDHDLPGHFSGQSCLPEGLRETTFYRPGPFGHEREIARRIAWWEARRRELQAQAAASTPPPHGSALGPVKP